MAKFRACSAEDDLVHFRFEIPLEWLHRATLGQTTKLLDLLLAVNKTGEIHEDLSIENNTVVYTGRTSRDLLLVLGVHVQRIWDEKAY